MTAWRTGSQRSKEPVSPQRPTLPECSNPVGCGDSECIPLPSTPPAASPFLSSLGSPPSTPTILMRRSYSATSVVSTGTGLVKSAAGTSIRYSLLPMWGAAGLGAGVVQWAASGLTGGSPEGARDKGSGKKLGRVAALVSVELMLLENVQERILLDPDTRLMEVLEQVQGRTGVPPGRQSLVVAEDRIRRQAFTKALKRATCKAATVHRDVRATFISWGNFFFLPEAFNREIYGRGIISWAKSTTWWQSFQEVRYRAERATVEAASTQQAVGNLAKVKIELLSGKLVVVEVEMGASLAEFQEAIRQKMGIMPEQQRIIVVDKQACGTLTVASNMLLLATLKAVRSGLRLGLKVGTTLFVRAEATYTATLHTSAVRQIPVTVNGDTSVNQLRRMLEEHPEVEVGEDLVGVSLPPNLPPLRVDKGPCASQIIKSVIM